MKNWVLGLAAAGGFVAALVWGWQHLFPRPEVVIRKRMVEMARAASFSPGEGNLAKFSKAQKLTTFFATDAEIIVDAPRGQHYRLSGHQDLLQAALSARQAVDSLKIEFLDVTVEIGQSGEDASVSMTVKGKVGGERDYLVQELRVVVQKTEGNWLIKRIETVKVLSLLSVLPALKSQPVAAKPALFCPIRA